MQRAWVQSQACLCAIPLLGQWLLVIEVAEAEGQAHGIEAEQLQPVHYRGKVHGQAVCAYRRML